LRDGGTNRIFNKMEELKPSIDREQFLEFNSYGEIFRIETKVLNLENNSVPFILYKGEEEISLWFFHPKEEPLTCLNSIVNTLKDHAKEYMESKINKTQIEGELSRIGFKYKEL
jgi:hypothetical protein